ncbi:MULTISPECIES: AAA family ATPase [Aeromonas]|uniref:AAA family ATPase n=1 Tax=Aeromonas hydrophila TaxID=644 RepID=A0AAX3PDB2_AERHY|nr:AAA family ATPase [Aeromonas hydrophila]MCV9383728.1 AAA family ATPase [Aeromonas hydrophila]WEE27426.1 AAA family ATPase [Aeromonas hydrophila]HDT5861751.1 ATP-binding protein [Aeromonas hydrophila subsp. hydrophila]
MEHIGNCNPRAVASDSAALRLTQKAGCPRFFTQTKAGNQKVGIPKLYITIGIYMLTEFTISNYKQFSNLKIKNLENINIIGGKNNTGKSSILEAIFTLYDRGSPELTIKQYAWRGIGNILLDKDSVWAPIFHNYDLSNQIDLVARSEDEKLSKATIKYGKLDVRNNATYSPNNESMIINQTLAFNQEGLSISYVEGGKSAGKVQITSNGQQMTSHFEMLTGAPLSVVYLSSSLKGNAQLNAEYFTQLDKKGLIPNIVNSLKVIEPKLKNISLGVSGGQVSIYGDVGLKTKIPIGFLGEGIEKLLGILLAIEANKGNIILIDEIENGLHYSALPQIWGIINKAARENKIQLFITTHSYEALVALCQSALQDKYSDISYYRLDKETENIKINHYNFDTLKTAIESNWEVR